MFDKGSEDLYFKLSLIVKNDLMLDQALTHKSYAKEHKCKNNQRLEFLGDAVLELAISNLVFKKFKDFDEGRMSMMRSRLVDENGLYKAAGRIGLPDLIKLGKSEIKTGGRQKKSIVADCFEAVVGAIYLAVGFDKTEKILHTVFDPLAATIASLKDPKTRTKEIERLQEKMRKLQEAEQAIKEKQVKAKTKREKELTGNKTCNTIDSEAKLMKMKKGKTYQPAYNGQIATSNQIILAYEITDERVDTRLLIPMINKTENNTKKKVKRAKADASYFSKNNLKRIEEKEVDAYIPDQIKTLEEKQERNNEIPEYDKRNFKYNKEKDEFICPEKKRLLFKGMNGEAKKYVCSDCQNCPAKSKCAKSEKQSISVDWRFEKYKREMRKKLNSEEGKSKYLERMSDVEPVFGNIIYNQNSGYFLCRGKPMVKIEFGLSCLAHNLVKMANWIKNNKGNTQLETLTRL